MPAVMLRPCKACVGRRPGRRCPWSGVSAEVLENSGRSKWLSLNRISELRLGRMENSSEFGRIRSATRRGRRQSTWKHENHDRTRICRQRTGCSVQLLRAGAGSTIARATLHGDLPVRHGCSVVAHLARLDHPLVVDPRCGLVYASGVIGMSAIGDLGHRRRNW